MESEGKPLKYGYTTGASAAASARAAALLLIKGSVDKVDIPSPSGRRIEIPVKEVRRLSDDTATACVVKDAGDDAPYDVTHGLQIWSDVTLTKTGAIHIRGGEGVGIVTKPGLPVPIGEPAINPVPSRMITEAVKEVIPPGVGAEITLRIPDGEKAALKTLNAKLGIIRGISILGTTGIVTPKSIKAYRASLLQQVDVALALGHKKIVLVPGNIGEKLAKQLLDVPNDAIVQTGDYVGYMIKRAVKKGIEEIVFVGHPGKLVKVAAAIFNTHHKVGDARMEVIAAYAAAVGASKDLVNAILAGNTTEDAVDLLRKAGILKETFQRIVEQITLRVTERIEGKAKVGTIIVALDGEVIGADIPLKKTRVESGLYKQGSA